MDQKPTPRILIVEDEPHISEGIQLNLTLKGYTTKIAANGITALKDWKEWNPDLIVLDIMLPCIDGMSVLQNIRLEDDTLPILILSAKSSPQDKINGFSHGVDDYMTKPFNLEEFLLRVERLFKRAKRSEDLPLLPKDALLRQYCFGPNRIDFDASKAFGPSGEVILTEQEIKLLKLFLAHKGRPLSRKKILEVCWGYTGSLSTRTVDTFIVRLRKYFEPNPKKPIYFLSRRSIGYIFDHD